MEQVDASPPPAFSTNLHSILLVLTLLCNLVSSLLASIPPPCKTSCRSLAIKYPFGTGYGCGSPRFYPYVTCSHDQDHRDRLLLTNHTGSSLHLDLLQDLPFSKTGRGLDETFPGWHVDLHPSPLHARNFIPHLQGICDLRPILLERSLCIDIHLPCCHRPWPATFPPMNNCCVYSPANFDAKGDLDLRSLSCTGYTSVVTFRDYPTDPSLWDYGVEGAFDSYNVDTKCNNCEISGGIRGYTVPTNTFVCVCYRGGYNTTSDCNISNEYDEGAFWSSSASSSLLGKPGIKSNLEKLLIKREPESLLSVGISLEWNIFAFYNM